MLRKRGERGPVDPFGQLGREERKRWEPTCPPAVKKKGGTPRQLDADHRGRKKKEGRPGCIAAQQGRKMVLVFSTFWKKKKGKV